MKIYKVGDKFRNSNSKEEYVLVSVYPRIYGDKVCLINLTTWQSLTLPIIVGNIEKITHEEMKLFTDNSPYIQKIN
jgi:hypothetical protein